MSTGDSNAPNSPNSNPSSGDFLIKIPVPVCINIPASNEEEIRNSGKNSESLLVRDANPVKEQKNDEAGHRDTECNAIAMNDAAKIDIPPRGRSLKKENPTTRRDRENSPPFFMRSAKGTTVHKRFMVSRRKPTPHPTLYRIQHGFDE
ncbi:hypothetical protein WUBG_00688 [Wuchereria bancrofti]|uniref:Uncharacterized protein n=1 Tax=Wuchereria bancrofti TaxID=6293 RepID=J9F1N1_WUCBA|nr:hypothetical protein WUBG_00688 [Wuchereria bancrofti]